MNRWMTRRRRRRGFTLMEVLLVLVILVILGSFAGVAIRQQRKRAWVDTARAQIKMFENALDMYEMDVNNFPNTSQGLEALIALPSGLANDSRWRGPYLKTNSNVVPLDPWDNPYRYSSMSAETYEIRSAGPDGAENTDDDITN